MALSTENVNKIITEAQEIEAQEAKEAGSIGFMPRALTVATMPHNKLLSKEKILFTNKDGSTKWIYPEDKAKSFIRKNGNFSLYMIPNPDYGLPYGTIPRLIIAWLTTEAVKTKSREIVLGRNIKNCMDAIGLKKTGGERGDINRFKQQIYRLFYCHIQCIYKTVENNLVNQNQDELNIIKKSYLWWDKNDSQTNANKIEQLPLFESYVLLSQEFFDEIIQKPVPIDLRAIKALKNSSMAIDIYIWLTYKNSYLSKSSIVPWEYLQFQFGSNYKRLFDFRIAFKEQLLKVKAVYPDAHYEMNDKGLFLYPSPSHVKKLIK